MGGDNKNKKLSKNRGILKPSWAFVETNTETVHLLVLKIPIAIKISSVLLL
jgi:hypothetical protein